MFFLLHFVSYFIFSYFVCFQGCKKALLNFPNTDEPSRTDFYFTERRGGLYFLQDSNHPMVGGSHFICINNIIFFLLISNQLVDFFFFFCQEAEIGDKFLYLTCIGSLTNATTQEEVESVLDFHNTKGRGIYSLCFVFLLLHNKIKGPFDLD